MSVSGILIGLGYIALTAIVLLLLGALIVWGLRMIAAIEVDAMVRKLYLALVAVIVVVQLISLVMAGHPIPFVRW